MESMEKRLGDASSTTTQSTAAATTALPTTTPTRHLPLPDPLQQHQRIHARLSRRQPMPTSDDGISLDPIEWTVRKLVPIPETYFWEYNPRDDDDDMLRDDDQSWQAHLSWRLRTWHRTIGTAEATLHWMDRWIAQPVARTTGVTDSRFSDVTQYMTEEDWATARQTLASQRRQRMQEDTEAGRDMELATTDDDDEGKGNAARDPEPSVGRGSA
jgi:hypothetical protein